MEMSPYEADLGWQPASLLDLLCRRSATTIQNVNDLKACLASSLEEAKFSMRLAQACQSAYNQKRYTPPKYKVSDHVFISRKLFSTAASDAQPSQKIGVVLYDLFKILELIEDNIVGVQLPDNIRIRAVVHVEHTFCVHRQPAAISSPQPKQAQPFTDPSGELVIEVECILANRRRGKTFNF